MLHSIKSIKLTRNAQYTGQCVCDWTFTDHNKVRVMKALYYHALAKREHTFEELYALRGVE